MRFLNAGDFYALENAKNFYFWWVIQIAFYVAMCMPEMSAVVSFG